MVKPEQFDHLHLVYDFTVPLSILSISKYKWSLVFKYLQKPIMFTLLVRKGWKIKLGEFQINQKYYVKYSKSVNPESLKNDTKKTLSN